MDPLGVQLRVLRLTEEIEYTNGGVAMQQRRTRLSKV